MSKNAKDYAREARAAYYAKYKENDLHEAVAFIEKFLARPMMWKDAKRNEADRQKAEDALKFVLSAWNVEEDEGAEGICRHCGESCLVEDQKWVHRDESLDDENDPNFKDHLAEPEED